MAKEEEQISLFDSQPIDETSQQEDVIDFDKLTGRNKKPEGLILE